MNTPYRPGGSFLEDIRTVVSERQPAATVFTWDDDLARYEREHRDGNEVDGK